MKLTNFLAALTFFTTSFCASIPIQIDGVMLDDTTIKSSLIETRDPRKGRQNCGYVGQACPGG
ncbi:hypothetical protein OnM2_c1741o13 [Erysiphe neolycopersici]|uniref:Uncharacterized protein n=1 Tax=Erysiphe neolycopersici TaxID=212602 RepID=A0A420I351_9PEZI|nr:hypothetical protein OnM2_c1741o13 [Erysiphe neolycopersici]